MDPAASMTSAMFTSSPSTKLHGFAGRLSTPLRTTRWLFREYTSGGRAGPRSFDRRPACGLRDDQRCHGGAGRNVFDLRSRRAHPAGANGVAYSDAQKFCAAKGACGGRDRSGAGRLSKLRCRLVEYIGRVREWRNLCGRQRQSPL